MRQKARDIQDRYFLDWRLIAVGEIELIEWPGALVYLQVLPFSRFNGICVQEKMEFVNGWPTLPIIGLN